jgi:signal transduction histidine kinase
MKALALVLIAIAVVVPCTIWFVAGSRAADREAQELDRSARQEALGVALRLAERLASRLEGIREAESRRPIYHYEHEYHDPGSTCACASVTPSPLAQGPGDPLIWTHFQIDPARGLTLPNPGATEIALLRPQAAQIMVTSESIAELSPRFEWRTVPIGEHPELVAVRRIQTAEGPIVQGIVIARDEVAALLHGAALPAQFLTGDGPEAQPAALPATWVASPVPIECVTWHVAVDASTSLAAAGVRGREIHRAFTMSFLGGAAAAALAGLTVAGLVWQADRMARERARFAAVAAHELRTPLASLRVYAEMLAEGLGDPARVEEYARVMAGETDRLGRVVANVLGYSRLERRALTVHPAPGDLPAAVRSCLDGLRPALASTGAEIELRVPPDLPAIEFDRDAVSHIVQNLVDNAARYGGGNGDRRIQVALARAGAREVAISVTDHGPGVPKAIRSRLFRPFQQGPGAVESHRTASAGPAGLGLGLALVRELARAHGGDATHADAPGGGSTFTVTLAG